MPLNKCYIYYHSKKMNYKITILLTIALISVSTSPIIAKMLENVNAVAISFWRMFIGSGILWIYSVFNNQGKIFINKIKKEIPASRMANVNDFDGIVLYLLSDDSKYTNGSFISVDGGRGIS